MSALSWLIVVLLFSPTIIIVLLVWAVSLLNRSVGAHTHTHTHTHTHRFDRRIFSK